MEDGSVVIGAQLDTKSFDAQIEYLERKLEDLEEDYDRHRNYKWFKEDSNTAIQLRNEIEQVSNKLVDLYDKQNNVGRDGFENMSTSVKTTNFNLSKMIKKVARLGLAFLGIRGAFTFIRQAISSVLSNNEKLKKQYDGLKQSLYAAFTPVVEKIINLMRTLMAYANYIWKRLFGKDLFASSVKSSSQTAKNAKEINKQLAGFDEANVLNDNKSSAGGAGGGNTDIGLANVKIPDWLVKLMDWVDEHPTLSKILFGLTAFTLFGGWKLASGIGKAIASVLGSAAGGTGLLGLQALLVGGAIAGTAYIVWNGFDLLGEHIAGIQELRDEIKGLEEDRKRANDNVRTTSTANMKIANSYVEQAKSIGLTGEQMGLYRTWIKDTITSNSLMMDSEGLSEDAKLQLRRENEHLIKSYEQLYKNTDMTEQEEYNYYKFLKDVFPMGIDATNQELSGTRDIFKDLDKKYGTVYEIDVKENGTKNVSTSLDNLKKKLDDVYKKWNTSSFGKAVNKVASNLGIIVGTEKHASGGIVNLPGKGVPINHIAGEAGREGIVPMDNQQQMEVLGQAIAKYVNINNIINNYMDARKINSILQTSASKEKLANNG